MKGLQKLATAAVSLSALGLYLTPASAELFINPTSKNAQGQFEVSGFYGTSSAEYDPGSAEITISGLGSGTIDDADTEKGDLDRTFIGITGAYGISDALDIYGSFVSIMKAELEDSPSDGSGTAFALGVRGVVPVGEVAVSAYAQYAMIDEDYGHDDIFGRRVEVEGEGTELSAGVMASMEASKELSLYGGLEIILLSDNELKAQGEGLTMTIGDVKREDKFGFRVGAQYDAEAISVFLSAAFAHETGFMLGVSKAF